VLGLSALHGKIRDHAQSVFLCLQGKDGDEGQPLHLAGKLVAVVSGPGPEDLSAAHPDGGASLPRARAARALLLPGLLVAAVHLAAVLDLRGAQTPVGKLVPDGVVDEPSLTSRPNTTSESSISRSAFPSNP